MSTIIEIAASGRDTRSGHGIRLIELWDGRWWPGRLLGGLPAFEFHRAPSGLLTRRQLRDKQLSPGGQEPFARLVWNRDQCWAWLYIEELARPKRTPTAAQLEAIEKALAARKVCAWCGPVDYCVRTTDQLCGDCHATSAEPGESAGTAGWRVLHQWMNEINAATEIADTTPITESADLAVDTTAARQEGQRPMNHSRPDDHSGRAVSNGIVNDRAASDHDSWDVEATDAASCVEQQEVDEQPTAVQRAQQTHETAERSAEEGRPVNGELLKIVTDDLRRAASAAYERGILSDEEVEQLSGIARPNAMPNPSDIATANVDLPTEVTDDAANADGAAAGANDGSERSSVAPGVRARSREPDLPAEQIRATSRQSESEADEARRSVKRAEEAVARGKERDERSECSGALAGGVTSERGNGNEWSRDHGSTRSNPADYDTATNAAARDGVDVLAVDRDPF